MINNKNGPPKSIDWLKPPNRGEPRGPSPGLSGHAMNVRTGYFDRNGRSMPEEKVKVNKTKFEG